MQVKTLILGGGMAGLSTAYHLKESGLTDYLVVEKEQKVGGLCRSIYKDGFIFDYGGHLLHLHTQYGKGVIKKLLQNNLNCISRKAWIYADNYRVPFPFQSNLYALPSHVRDKCIEGLLKISGSQKGVSPQNFEEWCISSFGEGIYKVFMYPYNRKLWGCEPKDLTCDWCGKFVPAPSMCEIKESAIMKPCKKYGYNSSFYYPKHGGCEAVIEALTKSVSQILVDTEISQIDLRKRKVFADGAVLSYDYLVNTLPLSRFLYMLQSSPLTLYAEKLRSQDITVFLIAIKGNRQPFSWIYFPNKEDPFFRVGMQSSFSSNNAPSGCYSYYVEMPGGITPSILMEKRIIQALSKYNLINDSDEVLFSIWEHIPNAYVIYDSYRSHIVKKVLKDLESFYCYCAGRYGMWEYSFMERALIQGKEVAEKIINNSTKVPSEAIL